MMANTYDVGDLVRVTGTFTDANGDATDPETVTAKYQDPSGNETSDSSPTKSATGIYYVDIQVDEAGTWFYKFLGQSSGGSNQGAGQNHFFVGPSQF